MSFNRIMALAARIIQQVLRDKRTLALIFLVPLLIMTLLYLVLTNTSSVHTLAIVYPTGTGSQRIKSLINSQLPDSDKLHTISISSDQVDSTLKNGNADAAGIFEEPGRSGCFTSDWRLAAIYSRRSAIPLRRSAVHLQRFYRARVHRHLLVLLRVHPDFGGLPARTLARNHRAGYGLASDAG